MSRVLANGRYEVEATAGLVSARRMIEITAQGPTPIVLDLNAALLSIAAPQTKGAAPPADATVTVLAVGASGDGSEARGAPLWIGRGGVHDLVVPAGSYRVKAAAGLASAERVVSVGQGVVSDIEMPLGAGRLVVEVRAGSGQEDANPPQILIEADDPESTGGRRELFRAAERRLEMTVPAGTYLLTVRRDAAELRERLLIRAGETLSRPVTLPIARIRLVSRIGNGMPAGLPVAYRIERLDTQSRPIQRWEAEPVVDLSPGRYRFEVRLGAQNAVAARDLEVRAGSGEVRIDLDTGAGGIQLKLDGAIGGLGLGEVYWQVFNDKGESVWRTGLLEPLMALGAGRYRVRADVRERVLERTFDVRAGDSKVIEVGG